MHRCLHIPDFLCEIFKFFGGDTLHKKALLSLALSCQTFQDQALNLLWHTQTSLHPLFKTLPQDLWALSSYDTRTLTFIRNPNPSDWARLMIYAPRIRELRVLNPYTTALKLDRTVYKHTKLLPPLLSRFKRFYCHDTTKLCDNGHIFLNPNVEVIRLEGTRPFGMVAYGHLSHFLELSLSRCPSITELKFKFELSMPTRHQILNLIYGSRQLRYLSCDFNGLDEQSLAYLSELQTLQEMEILNLGSLVDVSTPGYLYPRLSFGVLRHLRTEGKVDACTSLFRYFSFRKLQLLAIDSLVRTATADSKLFDLFEALGKTSLHKTLRSFQIYISYDYSNGNDSDDDSDDATEFNPLSHFAFKPFLKYSQMETFNINYPTNLDDTTVLAMALAWPQLRKLSIGWRMSSITQVTLQGLVHLVEHCPQLETLRIVIDTPAMESPVWNGVVNTKVTSIDFRRSTIGSTETAARFLCDLFVNLKEISHSWTVFDLDISNNQETCLGEKWRDFALLVANISGAQSCGA
jgi:hypothetical protein